MMNELNILRWYDRLEHQERFRWFQYGVISCLTMPNGFVPPFQKIKGRTGADVSAFTIVNYDTGTETNILSQMVANGLEVVQPADRSYDLIIYPSTIRIDEDFPNSKFYAVMTCEGVTWYSEFFSFIPNMDGYLKLEWCHNRDFVYEGGHIQYTESGFGNGYKNYMWIEGDLAKPQYPSNKEFEPRGGRKFPTFQTSSKEYRLVFKATEWMLDALRVVDQHDMKKVYWGDRQIMVNEFIFNQEWNEHGNLAAVTASIFTDRLVVETVAPGAQGNSTCEIAAGTCVPTTGDYYSVKTEIPDTADNRWTMGFYYNSEGNTTELVAGEYVILKIGPNQYELHQYNAPNDFTFIDLEGVSYAKIYVENTNEYLYDRGDDYDIRRPRMIGQIAFVTPASYLGETMDNGITELYLEYSGGLQEYLGQYTNADLQGGVEIDVGQATHIVLKVSTVKCGVIMEDRFEIMREYTVFTETDDDDGYVITALDDDDTTYLGDQDITEVDEIL